MNIPTIAEKDDQPTADVRTPVDDWQRRVTRAQEGILSAESVLAGRPSPFHLLVSADITGPLDAARLRGVLARVTRRHGSLRSVYVRDAATGALTCRVLPAWQPTIVEQDLPPQAPDADPVDVVHRLLGPAAPQLLRPDEQPPVVFVLTHAGPERAVLSIVAHHVVLDGWSIGLLWHEIAAGYADTSDTDPDPAPGMDLIVKNEQAALATNRVAERAAMLVDWPSVTELPSDLDRPASRTFAGARLPFTLSEAARSGCDDLAGTTAVSRNVVLLAAWALAAARRTASRSLLVGVPTPGRASRTAMQVVGGATGLGAIACEIPADGSVVDYLRRTAQATRESLRFGSVPFEDLATALSAGGDRSRNPLAQLAFGAHYEVVPAVVPAGPVTFDIHIGHTGGTAYDAMLNVMRWGPSPLLELEYATSVLTAQEAADLAAGFDQALVEMAAAPDAPLTEVTTITAAQRRRLAAWESGAEVEFTDGLWQLIESAAERTPEAVAVRGDDPQDALTYRQLVAGATAQSARLAAAGVGEGDRVALAVGRSVEEIVAIAAILRIGAAYVGIDAENPPEANTAILDSAQVRVIIGEPAKLQALGSAADGRIALSVLSPCSQATVETAPRAAAADPDRIAYLAFTSGTTGKPKGAMITCRAVVRLAHQPAFLSPGATARFLRLAPLAFDASTLEIFAPLLAGGTVEVYGARHVTASALARFLAGRSVTGLWLSAGLFRLVADFRPDAFRDVIQLLTGGDVVPPAQVSHVLRACPGLRITNGYGPTENTTFTTVHHVDDPAGAAVAALPIGRPIQGTGVLVLDPRGRRVPPGGIGELFTFGDGLATGYAGLPRETDEAFGDFDRADGRRLYRTGDLVRWDADGNLRFLGRRDRQAKIRGFRVEPEAIACLLREHPEVRDAAVAVVPLGDGDHQLLAAVTAHAGADPRRLPELLRPYAAQRLPGYAVPGLWAALDEFPVTHNGKLDIARLIQAATAPQTAPSVQAAPPVQTAPSVLAARSVQAAPSVQVAPSAQTTPSVQVAPLTVQAALSINAGQEIQAVRVAPDAPSGAGVDELADVIADAWAQVLEHRDFSRSDWFFDVGGDSLLLIRVHTILTHTLPAWHVSIADLYTCSAIDDLADKLRAEAATRVAA